MSRSYLGPDSLFNHANITDNKSQFVLPTRPIHIAFKRLTSIFYFLHHILVYNNYLAYSLAMLSNDLQSACNSSLISLSKASLSV